MPNYVVKGQMVRSYDGDRRKNWAPKSRLSKSLKVIEINTD